MQAKKPVFFYGKSIAKKNVFAIIIPVVAEVVQW